MIKMRLLSVIIFGFLFSLMLVPQISASDDTIIKIDIPHEPVIYLDSTDRLLRVNLEVENFDPSDGEYTMKIIQISTQKVISKQTVVLKTQPEDLWGSSIAYLIQESNLGENPVGKYEIVIETEFDSHSITKGFSVVKKSLTELENLISSEEQVEKSETSEQTIPEWVRNIFVWYGEKQVTEDELIAALKFLIQEGIIVV